MTELMLQRFGQVVQQPYDNSFPGVVNQNSLGKFLLSLAAWDGRIAWRTCALPSVSWRTDTRTIRRPSTRQRSSRCTRSGSSWATARPWKITFTFLETLKPKELADNLEDSAAAFRFLWRHYDEPEMREAADKLFGAPDSPCVPLLSEEGKRQLGLSGLIKTPLVGMPDFRKELERGRHQPSQIACARSSSSVTNSMADEWVASRSTGGATPASSASFQRVTHRHHRSPGSSPGKSHSGCGVTRSLPCARENSRNSRVIFAHTVCKPTSPPPVRQ